MKVHGSVSQTLSRNIENINLFFPVKTEPADQTTLGLLKLLSFIGKGLQ